MDASTPVAPLLEVDELKTYFFTRDGIVRAVDGVSFSVARGEALAIVGESGCGKSVTSLSILRLIASPPGRTVAGRVVFEGRDLLQLSEPEMRKIRGDAISMIFQEPMTSLNPVLTIGHQIAEVLVLHRGASRDEAPCSARSRCCAWFASRSPSGASRNTRTSFPAACGSGS